MKNNNLLIIAAVIVLVILLGGAGFMLLNKKSPPAVQNNIAKTSPTPGAMTNAAKTLVDLLSSGQSQRCTFSVQNTDTSSTQGTVYVSGGKLRGDFTATDKTGKKVDTSMIRTGDTNYIWGSFMPNGGIKMTMSLNQISSNKEASQYVDPTQKIDYKCSPWSVDSSLFTPPTNVKFTDMTSLLMPKATVTGTTAPNSDPCASITDPATKTACENALKQSGK